MRGGHSVSHYIRAGYLLVAWWLKSKKAVVERLGGFMKGKNAEHLPGNDCVPISLGQPNCLRDHASEKLNFREFNSRHQVVKINHMLCGSTVQIQKLLGV